MKRALIALLLFFIVGGILYAISRKVQPSESLTLFGNVDIRQADLGFRVFGKVSKLYVDEGDFVRTGDLLAELDKVPYLEQLASSEARVAALVPEVDNAKLLLERRALLIPSGGVSKQEFDDATAAFEQLKGDLESALANLASSKTALEDTRLFAPNEGTILTRIREAGSVLNPGSPVFTLSLSSPLWIRAYVSEPELGLIYPGMPAEIRVDSGASYSGHIGFISPVAEFTPKTVETTSLRTNLVYRIRVVIDNPERTLKQGMPATVILHRDRDK